MIGDEWAKAGQEFGKAGQEIGKATSRGIDAAQTVGGFFGKYLAGPLEQTAGMLEDRLRFTRWERQLRLRRRAQEFLEAQGQSGPTHKVALNFGVPLIEAASLEENDELQDVWAQLLANAASNEAGIQRLPAFVSMLKDMSPLDARILRMAVRAPADLMKDYVYTAGFPESYTPPPKSNDDRIMPSLAVETSLWNLVRLTCVEPMQLISGRTVAAVYPTTLGTEFVKAVSRPNVE
ncbi:Abi-alpha family protein [Bosea sp. NPDC055594]